MGRYLREADKDLHAALQAGRGWQTWRVSHDAASFRDHTTPLRADESYIRFSMLGDPKASKVLVVMAGVHGIEGVGTARAQAALVRHYSGPGTLLRDVRFVLISHISTGIRAGRRVSHRPTDDSSDGADLNRVTSVKRRTDPQYPQVRGLTIPSYWHPMTAWVFWPKLILAILRAGGPGVLKSIVQGGQFKDRNGLFYGGGKVPKEVDLLREGLCYLIGNAPKVCIIDGHTGLGDGWCGKVLSPERSKTTPEALRTTQWLGKEPEYPLISGEESVSSAIEGDLLTTIKEWFPDKTVTAMALEFGTLPRMPLLDWLGLPSKAHEMVAALRLLKRMVEENYLHWHPETQDRHPVAATWARRRFDEVFWPNDAGWQKAFNDEMLQLVDKMFRGLAGYR